MTPDWLRESVLKGIQGLLLLRLQGSPANDTVPALANAWIAILSHLPHTWIEDRDRPRIQRAFLTIASTSKHWPTPSQFIEAMPKVPEPLKLPAPTSRKVPPEVRQFLDKFLNRSNA